MGWYAMHSTEAKVAVKNCQLADLLKLPYESLPNLLTGLKGLVAMKHYSTNAFTLKTMAKKEAR